MSGGEAKVRGHACQYGMALCQAFARVQREHAHGKVEANWTVS